MPPKRKNKATKAKAKAAVVLPPKKPARNEVSEAAKLEPGQVRRNSLAATSGRTSRLLPSVPFQMTTRRGAKTASAGPSSASSGSRRSSLNDVAQFQDAPSEFEDAPKRSRTSTDSGSPHMSNGSLHNKTPMNGTQTPELQDVAPRATLTEPKTAGKRRRASDESTQSSKTQGARQNGGLTGNQSDASEPPFNKKRKTTEAPTDAADQPPELTDASTAPNSPEQIPEVDGTQSVQNVLPTNGEAPAKPGRRLPGRRRQPHADINIETDLRRQLNLKMGYRSIAKVQKALLEELSKRTVQNLRSDPNWHKQCPNHEPTILGLERSRDGRIDQLNAVRTHRLEQLERLRVAEEHIQREQYINRFQELQDDFLLQCYVKMKGIEREMQGEQAEATDDEDNVLPPTYADESNGDVDDRLDSKYASRSRAYVEADRELEDDTRRKRFDLARAAFVENNEDADDSMEVVPGGFAKFTGPDRAEAVAHHNLATFAAAATEVERTPSPLPAPPKLPVIANAQAFDLMMLADLSVQLQSDNYALKSQPQHQSSQQQEAHLQLGVTTAVRQELSKQSSPVFAPSELSPSQTLHSSPHTTSQPTAQTARETPTAHADGADGGREAVLKDITPVRVSTHRIMDILNTDQDVPVFRTRESQPPTQEPGTPRRESVPSQHNTPSHGNAAHLESNANKPELPIDQALMDALGNDISSVGRPSELPTSPSRGIQAGPPPNGASSRESEDIQRRRDPLQKIRELLDRKARELGRPPADRSQYGKADHPPVPSTQRVHALHALQDVVGYDPARPSVGLYSAPNSSYSAAPRRESQDHDSLQRQHDRRMSGSHAHQQTAQSPYSRNPPQPYGGEHSKQDSGPHLHQSPYAPPPGSLPLPPKPPGPPPAPAQQTFRFAHYDDARSRPSYPPPSPIYLPGAHHSQMGPPPPQYASAYSAPYPIGYVPPAGSFQAPPQTLSNASPFPPLKIHQYGGQPILPANMAPPPLSGPPMGFGQPQHPPVPSAPHVQQGPQYEQRGAQPGPQSQANERPPEPQSRPRRQYRSYHAPGTQFRNYSGPAESSRRRGG